MSVLEGIFWGATGIVVYAYLGYPLLILLRGMVWRRPVRKEPITPSVSLIICCHNEEQGIEAKLQNVLALDYPADRLQVVVASDGSTDATEEIVSRYVGPQLELLRLPRSGKAAALNAAVAKATGEILVFSDANSQYREDAIRNIVRSFADPAVGGVAGNQVYRKSYDSGSAAAGEQSYWSFDRWMKILQSRSGNTISATGAIYAIRGSLFMPVPEGVTDDFVTSTRVIAQRRRLVFDPEAICYEPVAGAARAEFNRKTRVITRGLRGVIEMRELLNPFRHGFYALQLLSHKVLRRLVVIPLLVLAVVSPLLWNHGLIYQIATVGQGLVYSLAAIGVVLVRTGQRVPKAMSVPLFFCMVNTAVLVAVWNILRGRRITVWNPHRGTEAGDPPNSSGHSASLPLQETNLAR
ncbi:Poly-beta-1,6-N-acetyl-D-glucosamine synthase [Maioricimonas rarisocia]|uniref:Poly-beta-1,6-N-acetyl-D-glucosamine synthase n=1 Tax=Maioricimonas rarisocia TaxID=2528026 RepID=A0A517ZCD9_9PLAN|nr:glycosyltransferase family 2 protein [Maioricimonas rarisocia]QDU40122.1 Poly-beta-1,6-N-acetyl-D-glucosamine synthase [Maioricimonas rarisocia]